jgi:hypothetical protein
MVLRLCSAHLRIHHTSLLPLPILALARPIFLKLANQPCLDIDREHRYLHKYHWQVGLAIALQVQELGLPLGQNHPVADSAACMPATARRQYAMQRMLRSHSPAFNIQHQRTLRLLEADILLLALDLAHPARRCSNADYVSE